MSVPHAASGHVHHHDHGCGHGHGHDHHHHHHGHGATGSTLQLALLLTLGFALVEAVAGLRAGSLALLGDAGHMVTDSFSLALAALAAWLAKKPPSQRHSYGLARGEVLAGFLNAGFMLAVVLWIAINAVLRLLEPRPVAGETVTIVAAIGLVINLGVAWLLSRGEQNLNTRGALLHVLGDLLGSVAALAAGLIISRTGWTPIDPLLSLLICALIVGSSLRLAREALHALLDGVPDEISLPEVGRRMAADPGVHSVHDLHIWPLSSSRTALSAHVVLHRLEDWDSVLPRLQTLLQHDFEIDHITLQPVRHSGMISPLPHPSRRQP